MKILMLVLSSVFMLGSCRDSLDIESEKSEIIKVLTEQQASWNAGNIREFMSGYMKSDSLVFIGSSGISYGWNAALDNYIKRYPDKEAMGKLHFDILSVRFFGAHEAYVIGKYTLVRKEDQPSGFFTLIWNKIDNKWMIISDQTCG